MDCAGCTMCCMIYPIPWLDKPAGEWCKDCDIGIGCKIYESIPEGCAEFRCAYNQTNDCSINVRPDKCKVVFERLNDKTMIGAQHSKHRQAYKKRVVFDQINSYLKAGLSVIIMSFTEDEPVVFPGNRNKREILNEYYNHERMM